MKVERPNFVDKDGNVFLVKCPKCKFENYAPAVADGVCAWCGYDANKPETEGSDETKSKT
jgi:hypothetical protein